MYIAKNIFTGFKACAMKIQNISITNYTKPNFNNNQKTSSYISKPIQPDTVSFSGRLQELTPEEKYERAMEIVDCFSEDQIMYMDDFDQRHLEGIQYGLKSFEGMSFKEIYFLLSNMGEITVPVARFCSGKCPVCAVDALPKDRAEKNMIHKMDFEDYSNFTNDLKSIGERLGFDMYESAMSKKSPLAAIMGDRPATALFYDSDCKDVWLEDKEGKIHEYPELNKMLYDATEMGGIFDTAGWSPTNTKVQTRMENLAKYYSSTKHQKEIEQINISINPYHGIMEKANEYKNKGDLEGYNRLKNNYVKNIANAIYTFTPLLDFRGYDFLTKAFKDDADPLFDDYKKPVLKQLQNEIVDAVEQRYKEDLKNKNHKFVRKQKDIDVLMKKIKLRIGDDYSIYTKFNPSGRKNMFSKIPVETKMYFPNNTPLGQVVEQTSMLVDVNGKIYFKNDFEVFETDKSFNFKNKDKNTKQILPRPNERIISLKDREFIEPD